MIVIYLGNESDSTRDAALNASATARLLTSSDVDLAPGVYFTSIAQIGGLPFLVNALNQSDHIIYVPSDTWSDTKNNHSLMKHWTEFYLRAYNGIKTVKSPVSLVKDKTSMLSLIDSRKTEKPQLWVAGCSVTAGEGVLPDERYGVLLKDKLGLEASFLALGGSSIEWQADQILRSDLRKGDTLVWGITSCTRMPYFYDNKLTHLNPWHFEIYPKFKKLVDPLRLDEVDLIYRAVTKIYQVINFCNKLDINCYLLGVLVEASFLPYLADLPMYIQGYGMSGFDKNNIFFDYGADNMHPGPLTHQWYADKLINSIKGKQ